MRAVDAQTEAAPGERPVLLLGLVGFARHEEQRIRDAIARASPSQAKWRISSFSDADAWLVNGSVARLLEDDDICVEPAGGQAPMRFHLSSIDRPIAFSEPVADTDFEPAVRFSLHSPFTVQQVLARLSFWLRSTASQLWLAAQLLDRESELILGGVYHLSRGDRLLAVVDLCGDVGVLPSASLDEFEHAVWRARPSSARYIPESFERASMSMLMWQYALRTQRDLLPGRYRSLPIHFRRPPKLEQRAIADSQLVLLRELACGPRRFRELLECTGAPATQLARDLAALYLVGSITTNPRRARTANVRPPDDSTPVGRSAAQSDWPSRPALASDSAPAPVLKDTVPAALTYGRPTA